MFGLFWGELVLLVVFVLEFFFVFLCFVSAIFMGIITILTCKIFPKLVVDNILIGSLMTLVPGVAITNALRDLFGGDLLSGMARTTEAILTAIALGGGIGIAIKLLWGVM